MAATLLAVGVLGFGASPAGASKVAASAASIAAASPAASGAAHTGAPVAASSLSALSPLQANSPIDVTLTAFKVVRGRHGDRLVDAASAKPGDVLEYRAVYRNRTNTPLRAVVGSLPIPQGTRYVAESARPANASGRTADGRDEALRAAVSAVSASAAAVPAKKATADYRSLRWSLGNMAGGATRSISARVRINAASAAAASAVPAASPVSQPASPISR